MRSARKSCSKSRLGKAPGRATKDEVSLGGEKASRRSEGMREKRAIGREEAAGVYTGVKRERSHVKKRLRERGMRDPRKRERGRGRIVGAKGVEVGEIG